jgi:hypothetical protein
MRRCRLCFLKCHFVTFRQVLCLAELGPRDIEVSAPIVDHLQNTLGSGDHFCYEELSTGRISNSEKFVRLEDLAELRVIGGCRILLCRRRPVLEYVADQTLIRPLGVSTMRQAVIKIFSVMMQGPRHAVMCLLRLPVANICSCVGGTRTLTLSPISKLRTNPLSLSLLAVSARTYWSWLAANFINALVDTDCDGFRYLLG